MENEKQEMKTLSMLLAFYIEREPGLRRIQISKMNKLFFD